jgi:hypothetical protein
VLGVKISWPYVFAPDRAYGLYVLDVSDPADIVEVASCPTPGDAMWLDIAPDPRQVYIADADGGLRIIDISDPLDPREVGFYAGTLEMATHVAVSGDSVYIADGGRIGLHVIDVSDAAHPIEVASHRTPGATAHDVAVDDGLVYLLDMTHVGIFRVTQPTGVEEDVGPAAVAMEGGIFSIYPNPFNAYTRILYQLPQAGLVSLQVYNIAGQRVQTLASGLHPAGQHSCVFDAKNLASGIYFICLQAHGEIDQRKVVLAK